MFYLKKVSRRLPRLLIFRRKYLNKMLIFLSIIFTCFLTLSWWRFLSYGKQSTDLSCKSMDLFLYDREHCHWVNKCIDQGNEGLICFKTCKYYACVQQRLQRFCRLQRVCRQFEKLLCKHINPFYGIIYI